MAVRYVPISPPACTSTDSASSHGRLLPLESGDRLTRCEFARRYVARPDLGKAELSAGAVRMPSSVRVSHARPHAATVNWLGSYGAAPPSADVLIDAAVRPDPATNSGRTSGCASSRRPAAALVLSVADYREGPPELIAEIAASSLGWEAGIPSWTTCLTTALRSRLHPAPNGCKRPLLHGGSGVGARRFDDLS